MTINVVIERLVLDGVPDGLNRGPLIQRALEVELAGLLAAGNLGESMKSGNWPYTTATGIRLVDGAGPAEFGRQLAGAIYGGLRP